nr:hypothetical protein Q903MT_gene5848 [Picea sitchensis]
MLMVVIGQWVLSKQEKLLIRIQRSRNCGYLCFWFSNGAPGYGYESGSSA